MRLAAIIAFATALAGPAAAEQRQFGDAIFAVPPQWDLRGGVTDGQRALWSDLPDDQCEFCRIMLGPSAPARGSVTDWLDQNRHAFLNDDDQGEFSVLKPAEPTTLGRHKGALLTQKSDRQAQLLVAVEAGKQFHLFGFQGDAGDPDDLAETQAAMSGTFVPWLTTLRFRSEGAPSLLGTPHPGDMNGVWWGFRMDNVMKLDMTMAMENTYRTLVFWPDGSFYEGAPPQGLKPLDRAALDAAKDVAWGNYDRQGDTLRLSFSDGSTESLDRDGDGWTADRLTLSQVETLPDGARLDGEVSRVHFTGFVPGSGISGGVGGGGTTVFRPDGSYTGASFGTAFGNFDASGGFATNGGNDADRGRYEIRDGLLIFSPGKGDAKNAVMALRIGEDVMLGGDFMEGKVIPAQ